ncbi:MAG TPA: aldehyde dehydrogenase family protein [Solirubrobacterales bacterium]|jgi:succinate-semialdehyde dehydrogenase/glutarate-semialdehyde dehydrogenase
MSSATATAEQNAVSIEIGMVGLNRGLASNPAAPLGGIRASGLGREGRAGGVEECLETEYVAIGRG